MQSLGRQVAELTLRVWTPQGAEIVALKQMEPPLDLVGSRAAEGPLVGDYTTGAWGDECRDFYLSVRVPGGAVDDKMLVARVTLLVGDEPVGQSLVTAVWTDDVAKSTRMNKRGRGGHRGGGAGRRDPTGRRRLPGRGHRYRHGQVREGRTHRKRVGQRRCHRPAFEDRRHRQGDGPGPPQGQGGEGRPHDRRDAVHPDVADRAPLQGERPGPLRHLPEAGDRRGAPGRRDELGQRDDMSTPCPRGHTSETLDYCSVCGVAIVFTPPVVEAPRRSVPELRVTAGLGDHVRPVRLRPEYPSHRGALGGAELGDSRAPRPRVLRDVGARWDGVPGGEVFAPLRADGRFDEHRAAEQDPGDSARDRPLGLPGGHGRVASPRRADAPTRGELGAGGPGLDQRDLSQRRPGTGLTEPTHPPVPRRPDPPRRLDHPHRRTRRPCPGAARRGGQPPVQRHP